MVHGHLGTLGSDQLDRIGGRGNGALEIANNSGLNGHLNLEIRSQVAQDRGSFSIAGTVARPNVKRGG